MARMRDDDYRRLLEFRVELRRFLHWSEEQAQAAGLTPSQHQLLLAIRGHPGPAGPTIGKCAEYLMLRHHSVVGLVDRAEKAGYVVRNRDPDDHRVIRLALSPGGEELVKRLSEAHLEELRRLRSFSIGSKPAAAGQGVVAGAAGRYGDRGKGAKDE
jgi:DNA-binding MarR family transcriptional regulator